MNKYEFLVDKFNNGEIEEITGYAKIGIDKIISLLDQRGYLDYLDVERSFNEEYHNEYYYYLSQNRPEKFIEVLNDSMPEISVDENGKIFLTVNYRSDLADLFCDDYRRNALAQSTVSNILDGENDWGYVDNTTDNIYRDVIEDLDSDNLKHFYNRVLEDSKKNSIQIIPQTELLEEIAIGQGHEDFVILDETNIQRILSDEESTMLVLDELEDIKSELYSIHHSAYNTALEDELFESVFKSLEDFFVGTGEWVSKPHPKFAGKTLEQFKIEINGFTDLMTNYFQDMRFESAEHSLNYLGDFLSILLDGIEMGVFECLTVYPPDYADWSKVKENINNIFLDYL